MTFDEAAPLMIILSTPNGNSDINPYYQMSLEATAKGWQMELFSLGGRRARKYWFQGIDDVWFIRDRAQDTAPLEAQDMVDYIERLNYVFRAVWHEHPDAELDISTIEQDSWANTVIELAVRMQVGRREWLWKQRFGVYELAEIMHDRSMIIVDIFDKGRIEFERALSEYRPVGDSQPQIVGHLNRCLTAPWNGTIRPEKL